MSEFALQKLVLGHNQFFGVDHLSSERGGKRAAFFSKMENVGAVIRLSMQYGAGGMMLSTHERAAEILAYVRQDPTLSQDLVLYPLLPYVQKYVVAANEKGMLNVVFDMLSGSSWADKFNLIRKGSQALFSRDLKPVLSALMDLELKEFKGLRAEAIFLHDAFTDLGLALGTRDIFEFYLEQTEKKFKAQGAFATKNLPFLMESFEKWGLPRPVVMTHFNKAGFHMNPSREECEQAAGARPVSIMAMGSLASGYLAPAEAYEYLGQVPNIDSVVVGASSEDHIRDTFTTVLQKVFA